MGEKPTHHGQALERAARRSNISLTELARKTGVSRRTLYNWFGQERLKTTVLTKVGSVLNCDLPAELGTQVASREQIKLETNIQDLKKKYIDLLDRHNTLLVSLNEQLEIMLQSDVALPLMKPHRN